MVEGQGLGQVPECLVHGRVAGRPPRSGRPRPGHRRTAPQGAVGGAASPVGTSSLGRPPKGAMLATTVTVRMRPARSTCNTALSAASLTYQPSTPSQTTSSGVLASSDRRGWRLAGRRLGRPPARQSSAAVLSPRSRAGRVADHHAHPYRRRPWPPARPGQVGVLLAAAAGRQQPVERHLTPAGGQVDCDTVPSPAPCR
jgi:hypothetical protein